MSTPQSVKDALADAETLRRVHEEISPRRQWRTDSASGRRYRRMAQRYLPMRDVHLIPFQSPDVAAHIATVAARAAFRAVPALRGEE